MRIGNNYNFNFNGLKNSETAKPTYHENEIISKTYEMPSTQNLQAYTMTNNLKGIEHSVIKPDYDAYTLIYSLKSPEVDTQKVKFVYSIIGENTQREAFSSSKNKKSGEFKIEIPVLNRKTNIIIPEFKVDAVEYFNDDNLKIAEEIPEKMVVYPKDLMTLKENRKSIINGVENPAEMDAISQGVSIGKLVTTKYEDLIRYKGTEPVIGILSQEDMSDLVQALADGTFTLPMNVKGLLASPKRYKQGDAHTDCLGHAVSRLRGRKIFVLMDSNTLDSIKSQYYNNEETPYVKIKADMDKITVLGLKELPKTDDKKITIPKSRYVNTLLTPDDNDFTPETVGLKAFNLGKLKAMQQEGGFKVPSFFVVPAGVWNYTKTSSENEDVYGDKSGIGAKLGSYHFYVNKADNTENPSTELDGIRYMITNNLVLPKDVRTQIKEKADEVFDINKMLVDEGCLIARSSFNGEDSDEIATQGLYDSFPGIRTTEQLFKGIKEVWASKWSDLAYMSRRNHKISHHSVQPNVIVQEVVPVDYTFTINTADPRGNDKNKIVCQLSQGVYSGFTNSPYIFEYNKSTGEISRTALANKKRTKPINKILMDDFKNEHYELADYSSDPLNMSRKKYAKIMKKVFDTAMFIEKNFDGKPQDIEGGIIFKQDPDTGEMNPEIYIWQTRDVHLIKR